jgi:hypothetical protein
LRLDSREQVSHPRGRRPCRVRSAPGGPVGGVAIELERSAKKQAEYERICRWYAGASDYRLVVWFVATDALQRRLAEVIADERLDDLMSVQPVPVGVNVEQWG